MKKNSLIMVVLFLALTGLVAGLLVANHVNAKKALNVADFHGTYLEHPRHINAFSLTGTDNKKFDNQRLEGRWTMVFFGFTSCGYLCPTTMAEIGKMFKILEHNGVKDLPQVVMITLDPERDPLNKLKDYVETFDSHFYGARAEDDTVKHMTREMGVMYAKVSMQDKADPKAYDIQHSGTIMLFNPEGKLNAFFTTPHRAEALAKDYQLLVG
jgi:protein SCO1/2